MSTNTKVKFPIKINGLNGSKIIIHESGLAKEEMPDTESYGLYDEDKWLAKFTKNKNTVKENEKYSGTQFHIHNRTTEYVTPEFAKKWWEKFKKEYDIIDKENGEHNSFDINLFDALNKFKKFFSDFKFTRFNLTSVRNSK
ncbi:MAG: hypothetical protein JW974_00110 [Alphaproteobacteria bacterium]|nr:hypothetical protein [Alphaproteobacteria bacterium]MBN2675081.1 hypothetical protein [Alphaproteobacteria bacterium]